MEAMTQDEARRQAHYEKMTQTPVPKLVTTLAIPTIISMMVSAIYNMADTFFVSQLGTSAVGAVGIVFSLMAIIQAVGFTLGMGSGTIVSLHLGAKEDDKATCAASTGFFTAIGMGLLLTIFGSIFVVPLMRLLGATETIKPYAVEYARYIFLATPFMMCSFIMNNLLRLQGLAAFAMVGITAGGILNIALDPIFIFGLGLGTSGAAIATGLSQFISFCILLAQCNLRRECIHIRIGNFRPSLFLYGKILSGGLPSLTRQGMASIATIVLNTTAHPFGDAAIAAMAIVNRLIYFVNSAVIGFGQGFQPVCGFSYGARKYSRVRQAYWFCVKFTTCILVVVCAGGFLVSGHVISLFRKNDPEVIAIGTLALRLQIATMWMNGFLTMSNMMSQSIGYGFRATLLAISRQGLFLIPVLLIAAHFLGLLGIQLAQPVADIATLVLTLVIIRGIFREFNKLEGL